MKISQKWKISKRFEWGEETSRGHEYRAKDGGIDKGSVHLLSCVSAVGKFSIGNHVVCVCVVVYQMQQTGKIAQLRIVSIEC